MWVAYTVVTTCAVVCICSWSPVQHDVAAQPLTFDNIKLQQDIDFSMMGEAH
jgi:hypothetical protein